VIVLYVRQQHVTKMSFTCCDNGDRNPCASKAGSPAKFSRSLRPPQAAGNGISECRDRALKIASTANAHRETKKPGIRRRAETAYFRLMTVGAVREDWMVEMIWTKLAAPHAVIEPVSETRVRNGIFAAETERRNGLIRLDCRSRDRANRRN